MKIEGVFVKLEYFNPSGSTKDRIAKFILEKAEKTGRLKKGMNVIEATSGNSGIAFSMVCAAKGYKMHVIIPEGLTDERMLALRSYGAKIITVPKKANLLHEAVELEKKYGKRKDFFAVEQFDNEWNIEAHEKTLGKEILDEIGKIDAFVAGIGTGGTLIGVGRALRKKNPKAALVAVEPEESAVMNGETPGFHKIEGIGDGFVPDIIKRNVELVDDVISISSNDAIREAKRIARQYGIQCGISSGANFLAAKKLKKHFKKVATVFPDKGDRYFSMGFY